MDGLTIWNGAMNGLFGMEQLCTDINEGSKKLRKLSTEREIQEEEQGVNRP